MPANACVVQAAADAALAAGGYAQSGHPWSGLTTYLVLIQRGTAFLAPDGTPYYPKPDYGFRIASQLLA